MASTGKCPYCGGTVRSDQQNCPNCGAGNENYVVDSPKTVFLPKTIEELKEYCAERGMPLLRMRFFIGEDYREPKAFGIYRDGANVVVYKNKADGSRAIRYRGRDEAHAVNEIFQKLLEECHRRGISPDGPPVRRSVSGDPNRFRTANNPYNPGGDRSVLGNPNRLQTLSKKMSSDPLYGSRYVGRTVEPKEKSRSGGCVLFFLKFMAVFFALCILLGIAATIYQSFSHAKDGYYSNGGDTVYYRYGDDWYYTYNDSDDGDWYEADSFPVSDYKDYRLGEDWDSDWGVTDFTNSDLWEDMSTRSSGNSGSSYGGSYDRDYDYGSSYDNDYDYGSSYDYDSDYGSSYDSWDSSDSDWDSDW